MKKLLPLLLFMVSCSKKEVEQPAPQKSYFTVTNNVNYDLTNVVVGDKGKLLLSIPSLKKGEVSQTVETTATLVSVFFDNAGKTYGIMDPFNIKPGNTNGLMISSGLSVLETTKTNAIYPK